jgi:hypothetical protein
MVVTQGLSPFFPWEHDCSLGQLNMPLFLWKMVFFEEIVFRQSILKSCLRTIYFHPFHSWMKNKIQEKVGSLGCK